MRRKKELFPLMWCLFLLVAFLCVSRAHALTPVVSTLCSDLGGAYCSVDETPTGIFTRKIKIQFGDNGTFTDVSSANPLPTACTIQSAIMGSVAVTNFPAVQSVSQFGAPWAFNLSQIGGDSYALGQTLMSASAPITIASDQSPLAVTGTFFQTTQPVSGPLTDTQIRATPVPISGTISGTGNFTAVQSIGTNLHTVIDSSALPTGAATSMIQSTINTTLGSPFQVGGSIGNTAFIANAGTNLNTSALAVESGGHLASIDTKLTAPLTTNSILQTGSAIAGKFGIDQTMPGTTNGIQVNAALPVGTNSIGQVTANAGTNLNTSALALETTQITQNTRIGDLTESAPATDTASSGLNGRAQRIAQNLTSIFAAQSDGTQKVQRVDASGNVSPAGDITSRAMFVTSIPVDGAKASYRAASSAGFASAALATDVCTITGSATKTVRVTRLVLTGSQTTASEANIFVLKRSTANTSGTSTALTRVPLDSSDSAATATVLQYTANPTLGSLVGNIDSFKQIVPVSSVGGNTGASPIAELRFGDTPTKAVVLRGTNEVLTINLGGLTLAGSNFLCRIEWTEEP